MVLLLEFKVLPKTWSALFLTARGKRLPGGRLPGNRRTILESPMSTEILRWLMFTFYSYRKELVL